MRHILEVPPLGLRPGDHQEVVVARSIALGFGVVRIERFDAIDDEPVPPQLWSERTDRRRPHAGVILGHLDVGAVVPAAIHSDFARLGSQKSKRHRAVGLDFRRAQRCRTWRRRLTRTGGGRLLPAQGHHDRADDQRCCERKTDAHRTSWSHLEVDVGAIMLPRMVEAPPCYGTFTSIMRSLCTTLPSSSFNTATIRLVATSMTSPVDA